MSFDFLFYYLKELFNEFLIKIGVVKIEYYYKDNNCSAKTSKEQDCICWHNLKTGPSAEKKFYSTVRFRNIVTKSITYKKL